jgi:hypothetical protein
MSAGDFRLMKYFSAISHLNPMHGRIAGDLNAWAVIEIYFELGVFIAPRK